MTDHQRRVMCKGDGLEQNTTVDAVCPEARFGRGEKELSSDYEVQANKILLVTVPCLAVFLVYLDETWKRSAGAERWNEERKDAMEETGTARKDERRFR